MKYGKVIIWGHPLHSHTHSYVHEAYYKGFKHLGYNVHWFHDGSYPANFDFENCLFIGEGFADKNIPLNASSCYLIMYCPSPAKYINAGVGRYIDVRMAAVDFKDHIQEYSLDKTKVRNVGPACYFDAKTDGKVRVKNDYHDYEVDDYDRLYISWATNLLPHEIVPESMHLPREKRIYFCGTLSNQGVCQNMSVFSPFIQECKRLGIEFVHNDPWARPLSSRDVIKRMQSSLLGVDLRGPEHLKNRMLTCRVFKNVSYGHLGVTNSEEVFEAMDGHCVYDPDPVTLLHKALENRTNFELIERGMNHVRDNHTYVNRIQSIVSIL